ncbi:hypothetical protein Tco_1210354 [Tanacetum coccineum]
MLHILSYKSCIDGREPLGIATHGTPGAGSSAINLLLESNSFLRVVASSHEKKVGYDDSWGKSAFMHGVIESYIVIIFMDFLVQRLYETAEIERKQEVTIGNVGFVDYCVTPVGTLAVANPVDRLSLNYDQVFIRNFALKSSIAERIKPIAKMSVYAIPQDRKEQVIDAKSTLMNSLIFTGPENT